MLEVSNVFAFTLWPPRIFQLIVFCFVSRPSLAERLAFLCKGSKLGDPQENTLINRETHQEEGDFTTRQSA